METNMVIFLKKFFAALFMKGVTEFPCYGDRYEEGIAAVDNEVQQLLPEDTYDLIADLFLLSPVQENHNEFVSKMFVLNGHGLSFSSLKNPYWETATIDLKDVMLNRFRNQEDPEVGITNEQYDNLADIFCQAAGM